jgi:hypothetical protein
MGVEPLPVEDIHGHHLMVTATGAVGVKVAPGNPMLLQIAACRTIGFDACTEEWRAIKVEASDTYDWQEDSTYIRLSPFFDEMPHAPADSGLPDYRL